MSDYSGKTRPCAAAMKMRTSRGLQRKNPSLRSRNEDADEPRITAEKPVPAQPQ